MEIVHLRMFGVISYCKTGAQDKEKMYIFLHILSVVARGVNICSEISFLSFSTVIRRICNFVGLKEDSI